MKHKLDQKKVMQLLEENMVGTLITNLSPASFPGADILNYRGKGKKNLETKLEYDELDSIIDKIAGTGGKSKKSATISESNQEDELDAILENDEYSHGYSLSHYDPAYVDGLDDLDEDEIGDDIIDELSSMEDDNLNESNKFLNEDVDVSELLNEDEDEEEEVEEEDDELTDLDVEAMDETVTENFLDNEFTNDLRERLKLAEDSGVSKMYKAPISLLEDEDDIDSVSELLREMDLLEDEINNIVDTEDNFDDDDDSDLIDEDDDYEEETEAILGEGLDLEEDDIDMSVSDEDDEDYEDYEDDGEYDEEDVDYSDE